MVTMKQMERGLSTDECLIFEIVSSLANLVVEDLAPRGLHYGACSRALWGSHRLRTLDYFGGSVPHKIHPFPLVLYRLDVQESHGR
jgi:hypothetical protein